jgi:phosphohistidine phosphatase
VKRLLILRHAKSSWDDLSRDDWARPLSPRGERDAPRVGNLLRERSLIPELIITSDAVRALTTARAVAEAAGYDGAIVAEPSLYHAKPDEVLETLKGVTDAVRAVMIVGHNPGLEDLVTRLTGEAVDLPTAALVHLAVPVDAWRDLDLSTGASVVFSWRPADGGA